ncbi:MAG: glycosyltransferase, partial [bacterium]|nr:glycosyltransferase [bacterium]
KDALFTAIVSKVHQKLIQKSYQVNPIILPHGCDAAEQIPSKRGNLLLAISRWQKEKNPQFLLRLLKVIPQAKMKIAGVWTKNSDLDEFRKLAQKLGVQKRIEIIPQFKTSQLSKLFSQARVFIHPHFEAFGMGGLEAASFGCPIIIPAGSGITNFLRDGIEGSFPKKISIQEYKRCLLPFLNNERVAYELGKNAWLKVKKESSWQAHTEKLVNLIENHLNTLPAAKITALEIGHAGTVGLAGGDRLFEEMVKNMPKKFKIEVITTPFGSKHWRQSHVRIGIKVLRLNPFERGADPFSVFYSYLIRIFQTTILLLKQRKKLEILYSSTNVLPDIFPAFIAKLRNPKIVWIARVHHLIPPPQKREGKLIVNIVSYLMQKIGLFCMRHRADLTIALNEAIQKHLIKIGFNRNRLTVLEAGIDFKRINEYQPKKTEHFDGIYLGRLHVTKGVFDTINIWKEVTRRKEKAKLAIIGAGPQYIKTELESQIIKEGLTRNIEILGYLPENKIYDYLKSSKVFLFTDHEAGWGLAIAEAMACGLPAVGYDIGILGGVFKKGFRVVKLGDTRKFAQEIIQLLENATERENLAHQALSQAKYLGWEKTSRKFITLIKPFTTSLQR